MVTSVRIDPHPHIVEVCVRRPRDTRTFSTPPCILWSRFERIKCVFTPFIKFIYTFYATVGSKCELIHVFLWRCCDRALPIALCGACTSNKTQATHNLMVFFIFILVRAVFLMLLPYFFFLFCYHVENVSDVVCLWRINSHPNDDVVCHFTRHSKTCEHFSYFYISVDPTEISRTRIA